MKNITSVLFILLTGFVGYFYLTPAYEGIMALRETEKEYNEALAVADEVESTTEKLLQKYNSLSLRDKDRLAKVVPDQMDMAQTLLDLDGVADKNNINIRSVEHSVMPSRGVDAMDTASVTFSVDGTYDGLAGFIFDLEQSLQFFEITEMTTRRTSTSLLSHTITAQTYWHQ